MNPCPSVLFDLIDSVDWPSPARGDPHQSVQPSEPHRDENQARHAESLLKVDDISSLSLKTRSSVLSQGLM